MRKTLVTFLLAIGGVAAVALYYWNKATYLPDWYTNQPASSQNKTGQTETTIQSLQSDSGAKSVPNSKTSPSDTLAKKSAVSNNQSSVRTPQTTAEVAKSSSNRAQAKTDRQPSVSNSSAANRQKNLAVKLNETDLNQMVVSEFVKKNDGSQLTNAVRAVNTQVQNGKIQSGAVISLANISAHQLQGGDKDALSRIVEAFPALKNRDVYIAIEGEPIVENGQLKFGDNTKIRLGNFSFTAAELAARLGVPEEEIKKRINFELQLQGVNVNDVKMTNDGVVVEGISR